MQLLSSLFLYYVVIFLGLSFHKIFIYGCTRYLSGNTEFPLILCNIGHSVQKCSILRIHNSLWILMINWGGVLTGFQFCRFGSRLLVYVIHCVLQFDLVMKLQTSFICLHFMRFWYWYWVWSVVIHLI